MIYHFGIFTFSHRYHATFIFLVWDMNMTNRPVESYQVHDYFRAKLCALYENDCIFDKFECCFSGDDKWVNFVFLFIVLKKSALKSSWLNLWFHNFVVHSSYPENQATRAHVLLHRCIRFFDNGADLTRVLSKLLAASHRSICCYQTMITRCWMLLLFRNLSWLCIIVNIADVCDNFYCIIIYMYIKLQNYEIL